MPRQIENSKFRTKRTCTYTYHGDIYTCILQWNYFKAAFFSSACICVCVRARVGVCTRTPCLCRLPCPPFLRPTATNGAPAPPILFYASQIEKLQGDRQTTPNPLMLHSQGVAGLLGAQAAACCISASGARGRGFARSGRARARSYINGGGEELGSIDRRRRLRCGSLSSSTFLLALCLLLPRAAHGFVPVSPSLAWRQQGRWGVDGRGGGGRSSAVVQAPSLAGIVMLSSAVGSSNGRNSWRPLPSSASLPSALLRYPGGQMRMRPGLSRSEAAAATAADGAVGPSEDSKSATNGAARRSRLGAVRRVAGKVKKGVVAAMHRVATPSRSRRAAGVAVVSAAAFCFLRRPAIAAAMGGVAARRGRVLVGMIPSSAGAAGAATAGAAAQEITLESVAPKLALWFTLFVTSAAFHSAEIAITTLYPWKVKEFAEEEGSDSPFQV